MCVRLGYRARLYNSSQSTVHATSIADPGSAGRGQECSPMHAPSDARTHTIIIHRRAAPKQLVSIFQDCKAASIRVGLFHLRSRETFRGNQRCSKRLATHPGGTIVTCVTITAAGSQEAVHYCITLSTASYASRMERLPSPSRVACSNVAETRERTQAEVTCYPLRTLCHESFALLGGTDLHVSRSFQSLKMLTSVYGAARL